MTFLLTVAFRATKIPTTLTADVPVAVKATKNLEHHMPPVNYRSWQGSFLELPKSYQQWEMKFLLAIAFKATKIQLAVGLDIPVTSSFQSYQNLNNSKS